MSGEEQDYRVKRPKQREGYKPSVSVKNVSISHCPPGGGGEGRARGVMKRRRRRDVSDQ